MVTNSERCRLFRIARETLDNGGNMMERLTQQEHAPGHVAIEVAYALQSGTYTQYAKTEKARATRLEGHGILESALSQCDCTTLLDCGAGEGTRWLDFSAELRSVTLLDASWSRLEYAQRNMAHVTSVTEKRYVKGNMMALPFAPGSFDAVFTSHAVEPNSDEAAVGIIEGLFAIARRLVVMFEPNYRNALPKMRERMKKHGYAKNIWDVANAQAGWTCLKEGDFNQSPNEDNRSSFLVFKRDEALPYADAEYVAPVSQLELTKTAYGYADVEGCLAYPTIGGIDCLAEEDGVFVGNRNLGVCN